MNPRTLLPWLGRALAAVLAWLARALGGWDTTLSLMFAVMGLDLLTGLLVSLAGKSDKTKGGGFLSGVFFQGLTRKLMMLLLVMLATALDGLMGTDGVCRLAVIGFYAANEGLSIVENAALLGLPFPQALLAVLERMKQQGEDTEIKH
jgi:toxin secretion/phage lysis holin